MSYWIIRFQVRGELSEPLTELLNELGAVSVSLENAGPDSFYEVAYPQTPNWREVAVTGLFPKQSDCEAVTKQVHASLGEDLGSEISVLDDQDWERSWLSSFKPVQVGPELWVCPSWLTPPVSEAVNLVVDPGLAFGTGTHATTALCLNWLDLNRPRGKRVIDFGCGSGILAVASLKLGAEFAWGVDIDPLALRASEENAQRNGVSDRYMACHPDDLPPLLRADLVVANILAQVLIDLSCTLLKLLAEGGVMLLTGILHHQAPKVRQAFEPQLKFDQVIDEEWSMLIGRRGSRGVCQ